MSFVLREVDPNDSGDAERLAELFNDFDSAWPGGFNRGLADTAEGIRRRLGQARRVAVCAVEHDGQFVGFCDLMPFPGDAERVYVNLLGVRAEYHGRGLGKLLLLEMVRRATELGYRQLSLHTWAGNTKAVPLYKRCGFQWQPDSDVHMQNFVPAILTAPVGREFFATADWYACHERELELAPDDARWHGMPVYEYRFRKGDDFLRVWIDRTAEGITAVETPAFLVGCTVPVEGAAAGETCPIEWTIATPPGRRLEACIAAEGDAGLAVQLHERVTVVGETTIRRQMKISPDTPVDREGDTPHRVRTRVLIGDRLLELETGVRVCTPVAVTAAGCGLAVGRWGELRITLRSHLDRDVRGSMVLMSSPGLEVEVPKAEFELPERSWTESRFAVRAIRRGPHSASLRLAGEGLRLDRRLPLRAIAGSGAVATVDAEAERAVLESAALRVEVDLRGGTIRLFDVAAERLLASVAPAEIGPPFSGYRVRPDLYRARIEAEGLSDVLVLVRDAVEIEGIEFERRVCFDGPAVMRIGHRLANRGSDALTVALRVRSGSEVQGHLSYPLPAGLVREPFHGWGHFPSGATDLLPCGGRLAESWCASEDEHRVVGQVWAGVPDEHLEWDGLFPVLTYELGAVEPAGWAETPPLWIVAGPGSWPVVRDWWRRMSLPAGGEEREPPTPRRVFEVQTKPSPAVLGPGEDHVRLVASNLRGTAVSGSLHLALEMASRGESAAVRPDHFDLPDTDRDHSHETVVRLEAPRGPFAGRLHGHATIGGRAAHFALPVFRLASSGEVAVDYEGDLWTVRNGQLTFRVVPAFGGSVTSLEWRGQERLRSAYPAARPFAWSGHWFGGIHPALGWLGASYLARESFAGGRIEREGLDGAPWRGVGVVCDPTHRDRRWLRIEADYLTLPGSNVVLVLLRWINRTAARLKVDPDPCLAVWLAPGKDGVSEAHWLRAGQHELQRRGSYSFDMRSKSWAAVADPSGDEAVLLVPAEREARASVEDMASDGQHLGLWLPVTLEPHETRQAAAWLVLCQTAELEAYAALRDLRPVPPPQSDAPPTATA